MKRAARKKKPGTAVVKATPIHITPAARRAFIASLDGPERAFGEYFLDQLLAPAGERKPPSPHMFHPEAIVDPSRLFASGIFSQYNPSLLVTRKGLTIFDDMKMDEQVKLALTFKKLACLAPGWQVVSPDDQEDDWEVTAFVRDNFKHFDGGWSSAVKKIMRALDYGFSVSEKILAKPKDAPPWGKGKITLRKLNECRPHFFDFDCDPFGDVVSIIQRWVPGYGDERRGGLVDPGTGRPSPERRFEPSKFVHYAYDQEHENPYGKSDLEAAYRPWWVKDNAYKWFAVLLERYGLPPFFLFYNPGSYQGNQIESLKKVVKNIQNATMGLLPRPKEGDLEFWTQAISAAAKDIFIAALGRFDLDIAKAVLMPSHIGGTTETKDQGSGGSLARSNVHFKMFMFVVSELQREVATVINFQIVKPLCDLNFPSLKSYPEFKLNSVDDEIEVKVFELWEKLVTGKIVGRTEDDEKHLRSALGFPENEDITLEPLPSDADRESQDKLERDRMEETNGLEKEKLDKGDRLERDRLKESGKLTREGMDREDRRAKEARREAKKKKVPLSDLTPSMRTFAEARGGEWLEIDGDYVCVRLPK